MTGEEKEQLKANVAFAFDIAFKCFIGVLTVLMAVVAYQGNRVIERLDGHDVQISDNEKRLSIVEASRYTAQNALDDRRLIQQDLKELRTYVDANNPPPWLVKSIDEIKADLKAIRESQR